MVAKRKPVPAPQDPGKGEVSEKHAAARDALGKARAQLKRRPEDTLALRKASLALLDLGELDEAHELITRALHLEPDNSASKKAKRKIVEAHLWRMVERGEIEWSGGKPKGSKPPIPLSGPGYVSDLVHQNRR